MLSRKSDNNNHSSPPAPKAYGAEDASSPIPRSFNPRKRDSGYGTDNSPFSKASTPGRFSSDSDVAEEVVFDLSEELQDVNLSEEVFPFGDDADDTDKEVEEILTESGELGASNTISQPIEINPRRPTAPLPTTREQYDPHDSGVNNRSGASDFQSAETCDVKHKKPTSQYEFRPVDQRNVAGAKTDPSTDDLVEAEATRDEGVPRITGGRLTRGNTLPLLQLSSDEHREDTSDPLPDIPFHRNRSVSLPEVQPLRQQHELNIGRTLRRISDEFDSFHRQRRRQNFLDQASSLPASFDLLGYWNNLRRYLSRDGTEGGDDPDTAPHKCKDRGYE